MITNLIKQKDQIASNMCCSPISFFESSFEKDTTNAQWKYSKNHDFEHLNMLKKTSD